MFGFIDTTKEINTQGIGLGLNISKDLVEHFGGFIQCDSTWQIGSTFTFMFVLQDPCEEKPNQQRCRNPIYKEYRKLDLNNKDEKTLLLQKTSKIKSNTLSWGLVGSENIENDKLSTKNKESGIVPRKQTTNLTNQGQVKIVFQGKKIMNYKHQSEN